ncbi:hypothetical protein K435DRAFT_762223 [Dendrothele bispora CBS 962.96]|uniref:Ion transport domain-containing protein n=1 Tax=Dendrothele bispora (strain CBS 962.96) TaxID=1314807 RepID=A0A4S8LGP3_DENBC|nr:hypothetical protein K435DRAFT_762223 [Dendrothele bispora CBS 962.96]
MSAMSESQPLLTIQDVDATPVYPIIHMIRADAMHFIDTPLTYEALTAPDLTYTLIRPLVEKYAALQKGGNMSIVFCLLINRINFLNDENVATASISRTRAALCEILAIRILREYGNNLLELATALTTSWPVYNGADEEFMRLAREERDDLEERVGNAIEMAILGKAKRFIKSSSCQKVIDSIWSGKCVYQAQSSHSILSDTYKRNPIHFYDPHKAPLLDHYRLKVPSIRSVLEYMNFLVLFVLFVLAIEWKNLDEINLIEALFMVYALGFALEKVAAMQEHGIKVYFKGTWNGFDLAFVTTFLVYATLRLYGVVHHNPWSRIMGNDCMALIACLMFPRLVFVTLKNNLMVLSLRSMIMQFVVLMLIAAFCFCGFLYALWTLSQASTISWWMLDLWFGLDASGFDKATEFHPVFGPVLMVTYACLSNTLLLTVLVSILSNTFSTVSEDAAAEVMFRRAVSTIEGVKADSLFSYQPPVNLFAVMIMLPLSYVLSPRWFHKVNVFMIRLANFPALLFIAVYERQSKKHGTTGFYETIVVAAENVFDALPRPLKRLSIFEGLAGSGGDIAAIFEIQDELDTSALDTRDDIEMSWTNQGDKTSPTRQDQQTRTGSSQAADTSTSQDAPRGSSGSNGRVHFETPSSPSPSNPHPIPRPRVNSVLNRGFEVAHSFTSPLAQIFQPLVVDDDGVPQNSEDNSSNAPPMISYGPASRRRLSSMTGVRKMTTDPSSVRHAFPRSSPKQQHLQPPSPRSPKLQQENLSPSSIDEVMRGEDGVISESPLSVSPAAAGSIIPTAGQVREEEANSGGSESMMKKLQEMEARQERIERLLQSLTEKFGKAD